MANIIIKNHEKKNVTLVANSNAPFVSILICRNDREIQFGMDRDERETDGIEKNKHTREEANVTNPTKTTEITHSNK